MAEEVKFKKPLRRHIRYKPESLELVRIDFNTSPGVFKPSLTGLVFSEAYGGCGFICLPTPDFQVGRTVRARVGKLNPLVAEIVWVNKVDEDVYKVGLKFLE